MAQIEGLQIESFREGYACGIKGKDFSLRVDDKSFYAYKEIVLGPPISLEHPIGMISAEDRIFVADAISLKCLEVSRVDSSLEVNLEWEVDIEGGFFEMRYGIVQGEEILWGNGFSWVVEEGAGFKEKDSPLICLKGEEDDAYFSCDDGRRLK